MMGKFAWPRKVVVEVCNARNLMPKDGQGSVSAYAVVDFVGQRRRTATCPRNLNLQWDERLEFLVLDPDTMEVETLELNLYNEKKGSDRHNFLGKVKIPSTSFAEEGEEVLSYYLLQKRSVFSQIKGEIGLKIWFVDGPLPPPVPAALAAEEKGAAASDAAAAKAEEKPTVSTATSHGTSQDQAKETVSQENNPEPSPLTPPLKGPSWEELSSWSEARLLQHSLQMDTYNALERMLVDESEEPRPLPLSLLETVTNNFSEDMKIGSGGFAVVYKGALGSKMIAVKKLSGAVDMDEKQFIKEIECLMKARHKNIVRFLGYCADTQGLLKDFGGKPVLADVRNRALCFEYVPKGSLDKHITDASCGLEWAVRYRIIEGICEGLHYLHKNYILHLDLKPANILVDDNMVPKIADFGLSRRLDQNQSAIIATTIVGSL
ncbi:hypothetical protein PR202_gb19952 [Eleusine coracana subsp. coracana]|uniref:non-specific serine/threonine protein kinase n=1 Tax=Eleusine coracana subsp. coracana TaxID=191504 RepID=A0AAV5F9G8_ELECO|nr:hypothetical protein PR202_gb19952 [Eleusine coracana subsp. coracana]